MIDPQLQAVQALRSISRNEELKSYLLKNKPLYKTVLKAAMRFIGGENLDECFETSKEITKKSHAFTIDFMGESTRDEYTANEATDEFLKVLEKIKKTKSKASISLDLSHIGMVIDKKLVYKNAVTIAQKANDYGIEMMISMEGIERTDDILNEYYILAKTYPNVGITLQAYLFRTKIDLEKVLKYPNKIRLVKGAYEAPITHALPWGKKTDKAYIKYMTTLINQNHLCSIATHDENLLLYADQLIKKNNSKTDKIEFEMLHGAAPELLDKMHEKGYKTREYLPYGKEWFLYVCHRLAENPQNIYQALADAVNTK